MISNFYTFLDDIQFSIIWTVNFEIDPNTTNVCESLSSFLYYFLQILLFHLIYFTSRTHHSLLEGVSFFFFRQRTANEWWVLFVLFWMMYNFQLFKQLILKLIVTLLTCAKVYRHFSMIFFTHCYCTWSTSLLEGFAFDRFRQWTANE